MKLISLVLSCFFASATATVFPDYSTTTISTDHHLFPKHHKKPGLRGVIIYTEDESFIGANIQVEKVHASVLNKLIASKEFVNKPTNINSAFGFFELLDGRCEVGIKCRADECDMCDKCTTCKPCNGTIITPPPTPSTTTPTPPPPPPPPPKASTPFKGTPYLTPTTPYRSTPPPWTGTYPRYTGTYTPRRVTYPIGGTWTPRPGISITYPEVSRPDKYSTPPPDNDTTTTTSSTTTTTTTWTPPRDTTRMTKPTKRYTKPTTRPPHTAPVYLTPTIPSRPSVPPWTVTYPRYTGTYTQRRFTFPIGTWTQRPPSNRTITIPQKPPRYHDEYEAIFGKQKSSTSTRASTIRI